MTDVVAQALELQVVYTTTVVPELAVQHLDLQVVHVQADVRDIVVQEISAQVVYLQINGNIFFKTELDLVGQTFVTQSAVAFTTAALTLTGNIFLANGVEFFTASMALAGQGFQDINQFSLGVLTLAPQTFIVTDNAAALNSGTMVISGNTFSTTDTIGEAFSRFGFLF